MATPDVRRHVRARRVPVAVVLAVPVVAPAAPVVAPAVQVAAVAIAMVSVVAGGVAGRRRRPRAQSAKRCAQPGQ